MTIGVLYKLPDLQVVIVIPLLWMILTAKIPGEHVEQYEQVGPEIVENPNVWSMPWEPFSCFFCCFRKFIWEEKHRSQLGTST